MMVSLRRIAPTLIAAGGLAAALAAGATPVAVTGALARSSFTPLAKSPELWATVDICNAPHHPNTIGIRGSMPSDGHPHDAMYMRFLVQSLDATTKQWADLGKSADSGFVPIGSAASTRQAGRTFELKPTPSAYTLRGQVEFQWRRSGHVVHLVSLPTTAGHKSLAGAEPKGFSAATCVLP
jgi:hypothetical protein